MKKWLVVFVASILSTTFIYAQYVIVDTGQTKFFNNKDIISKPSPGESFYGQDAQYSRNEPSYTDNNDGTITDNNTSLMWTKSFEVMSYKDAVKKAKDLSLGGYNDWRLPSIKEVYSLMLFSGKDVSSKNMGSIPNGAVPFIDTYYFDFDYGSNGDRIIDTQLLSSTIYMGKTMSGQKTVFGVNIADGRIKGYPLADIRSKRDKEYTVFFVRGNEAYGINDFQVSESTVSDLSTGLMWDKNDSKTSMSWEEAFKWVEEKNSENYLGYSDWRLPNAKELQSIVDYERSPQETNSAAIDPIFNISEITDEGGNPNYPFFWTSTTHENMRNGGSAVYICFGEALGFLKDRRTKKTNLVDVHGAGAQRSDRKVGNPDDFPYGHGPQGDVVRIKHYVRIVRDIN